MWKTTCIYQNQQSAISCGSIFVRCELLFAILLFLWCRSLSCDLNIANINEALHSQTVCQLHNTFSRSISIQFLFYSNCKYGLSFILLNRFYEIWFLKALSQSPVWTKICLAILLTVIREVSVVLLALLSLWEQHIPSEILTMVL